MSKVVKIKQSDIERIVENIVSLLSQLWIKDDSKTIAGLIPNERIF